MPFDPNAPVDWVEVPSGAPGGFDPNKPVDWVDVPQGGPGAFDPSQPFEVDASTVPDQKKFANDMADAIGGILSAVGGPDKRITKFLLRAGGKKTDMLIGTVFPLAGGAAGTAVAPGLGTAAGGAAGGLAGETVVELRQILRGEREEFSPGSLIGTSAVSAFVPKPLQAAGGSLLKTAGRTLLQRGKEGAILGGAQEAIREVIDEGKLSVLDIAENTLWGSAFGTAFGGLEAAAPAIFKAIRGKPPKEAVKTLREDGTPPAIAVADEIDAKLASGEVELPPPPDAGDVAIDKINKGIRDADTTPPPAESPVPDTPEVATARTALADPKLTIQYTVWPEEMTVPGKPRPYDINLLSPDAPTTDVTRGNYGSTTADVLKKAGADIPAPPDSLPPGNYTLDEIKAAIAKETPEKTITVYRAEAPGEPRSGDEFAGRWFTTDRALAEEAAIARGNFAKDGESRVYELEIPESKFEEWNKLATEANGEPGWKGEVVVPRELLKNARVVGATPEVGLGAASPKEFQPVNKSITGIKNEIVDAEREARGAPPLMSEARKDLGQTWDNAMKVIDENQNAADELLEKFRTKPMALNDEQTAILLHREIDLRNQFDRVTKNIDENIGTPDSLASDLKTQARVLDELNELETVARQAGTETGRGLNARKLMAAEDYSLAKMLTKRRAAKGGVKLTPEEEAQVKAQHDAIEEAQRALDQHEAQAELDAAITSPEAVNEQIAKLESELAAAPKDKSLNDFKKRIQKRIDELRKRIQEGDFSKRPAPRNRALDDEGNLLQAKLEEAKDDFRAAMDRYKFEQLSAREKVFARVGDYWDLARNFVTTGEFSTLLRQGFFQTVSHPIRTATTFKKSIGALFASKAEARALDLETLNDPSAAVAREAGVHFDQQGTRLAAREETVASKFGEELWGIRHFNQQSRVFLNKLRLDAFNSIKNSNPAMTKEDLVQVAKFVNESTGRGSLNKWGERNAQALNRVLFSARFQAARVQMLTGHSMWGGSKASRSAIAKEYVRGLVGIATVYSLYNIGFSDDKEDGYRPVSFDPRASNFGKMRINNTEIDPLAGFAQWIVYGTRTGMTLAASGGIDTGAQYVTGSGREIDLRKPSGPYDPNWLEVSVRFGRSKLHPIVGAGVSGMLGEDAVGDPTTWKKEALTFTHPMSYEDIWFAAQDLGYDQATAVTLLAFLGAGVNTFEQNEKKAMGVIRDPVDEINRKIREDAAKQVTLPSGKKVNVRPAK